MSLKGGKTMIKNDDWTWTQETLKSIIANIINRRDEYKEKEKTDFEKGITFGYSCVLDSIKNELEGRGYNFKDFMSDEDKDKSIDLID